MKKVLLAIAALSMVVVALAGCPQGTGAAGNSSAGNSGTSSSAN